MDHILVIILVFLNWDEMLIMTEIELKRISDTDMYLFAEKGMRGVISYIVKRFSKANNKYMKSYDDNKPSKYIMYLDANNFYGWPMSQYLPYDGFKWLDKKEIEYPDELHELHNDYPLAPEKLEISHNMMSNYCSSIENKYDIKIGGVNKLVPNLVNKSKYVLYYRNLQLYLSFGMKLTKVHTISKFK